MSSGGGNDAIAINDDSVSNSFADIAITYQASDWYFTVCACMTVATFAFLGLGYRKPRSKRIFHYITSGVTMVAAIAYFCMGSNLGWVGIQPEFIRSDPKVSGISREIFYVRYIDWFITTPLLLTDLLLTAGMPAPTILFVILVDWVMIVTGLVGALVRTSYKWGFYTFGCVALIYITYHLVWEARRNASRIGPEPGRAFFYCGSLTALLWVLYPIAWGVAEGGNVISPDGEAIFYGILDLLAKPGFGALLLWGHRNIDPAILGLAIRDYTETDTAYQEKGLGHGHHSGSGVGATNGTGDTSGTGVAAENTATGATTHDHGSHNVNTVHDPNTTTNTNTNTTTTTTV